MVPVVGHGARSAYQLTWAAPSSAWTRVNTKLTKNLREDSNGTVNHCKTKNVMRIAVVSAHVSHVRVMYINIYKLL